jgi:hypothetical protein
LHLNEAAEIANCTVRAILQHGAEGGLPIYALVDNYKFINIIETEKVPGSEETLDRVLVWTDLPSAFHSPLNGRHRVLESCLAEYVEDSEASLFIVRYEPSDGEMDSWMKRWVFVSMPPIKLSETKLVVMTADLRKMGLIPNDAMTSLSEFVDDPRWPLCLDIAIAAWREAIKEYKIDDRPRNFLEQWVKKHYPDLDQGTVDHICIVANWNKNVGRTRSHIK